MRLDDHRVAGGEAREQAGVAVPRRERAAADDEADAARHDAEVLFHPDRLVLALRLLPQRLRRHARQLVPRVRDGLEPAVLRVRAARLERHHERLPRRVHDGVGDLEARLVDPREDLDGTRRPTPPGPALRHWSSRPADRREQRRRCRASGYVMPSAMPYGERSPPTSPTVAGCVSGKRLPSSASNAALPGLGRAFAVDLGARRLGIGAPVAALGDRLHARARASRDGVRTGDATRGSSGGRRDAGWRPAIDGRHGPRRTGARARPRRAGGSRNTTGFGWPSR